jgi:hypothetical protein
MKWHEVRVEGTDSNASLGERDHHDNNEAISHGRVIGRYDIPHVNAAGRKMLQMLGIHEFCFRLEDRRVIAGKYLALNMSSFRTRRGGILPKSLHNATTRSEASARRWCLEARS